ncbi:lipopolysaccharide export system protein LptA [Sphingomonas vulcanisoli]|uniref:Lipopolysaccharide export system protein LptA n=1 Tax=Sphingomonas vulcanisoli TaxID=1658060 RepID=A0ABX0TZ09_9SPHN|nr:lipopolysaccharide transport periplasmic protein LptA [Sphingomonas vulcanisoli]NIJ08876.1 lipopolysaccharide export system protein LptA [Sphingomonas vulcanisoli]
MNRRLVLALVLIAAPAIAQNQGGNSALRNHDSNAPVDVTSDRSEVQDKQNRAIFIGNVRAVQGDMTLTAARVTVAYSKGANGGDLQIDRIDASGGVTVVDPSEHAKGNYGIYDLNRKIITLIGNVTVVRSGNTVNGARLVMDLNTGRSTVDGSAVGGAEPGAVGKSGGRVTGHFSVPQKNQTMPPAPVTKPTAK